MHDSLYRNSIFLMANTAALAGFGFIFWALAAHLYPPRDVGITGTLITASLLISTLGILGFDNSFIRFLPKSKKYKDYLDSGFAASTLASLLVSIIYLIVVKSLIPKLGFLDSSALWVCSFIIFMILNTLNNLTNFAFIAFRKTHLVLIINVGFGLLRLAALILLARFGLDGLILAHVIATIIALILTIYFMEKYMGYTFNLKIVPDSLGHMRKYAFSSYFSTVFLGLPTLLLPTLVISRLGAEEAAYYYIVAVIVTALNIIPLATSQSLFAEGSWNEAKLKEHSLKALRIIFSLMTPAIAILIIFGRIILTVFGQKYAAQGYTTLVLLALSGFPKIFNYVLSTILRIQHRVGSIVKVYFAYALVILIGSLWGFSRGKGLESIGISTLIAETIAAASYGFIIYQNRQAQLN